eukprot:g6448.t1
MQAVHVIGQCEAPNFDKCVGIATLPAVHPGPGQVLIKVGGSSVNPCDTDTVQGYPGCHVDATGTPGGDVAGEVVALGSGCSRLSIGDRVWANRFAIGGGMAEYALATEAQTGVMPASLSFVEAGTVPIVGGTALQCLQCLGPRPPNASAANNPCPPPATPLPLTNLTVVITSGSGGTGYLGVQLARALGAARVITAASGARAMAWMRALGADEVHDYEKVHVLDALADDSVDAVFDNYGGNGTADRAMPKLRAGGAFVLLPHGNGQGALSKHPKPGVRQVNFGDVDQTRHDTLDQLAALFDRGAVRIDAGAVPGVQQAFSFAQAASAYATVAAGRVLGKVAIVPHLTAHNPRTIKE